jgi:hypothetical protein
LDQLADAIGVVGLIRQHDGSRDEMVEQRVGDLPVMCLPCRQAEPDREPLRVDDDVDLGREPAPGATETVICTPLLPSRPADGSERRCCRSSGCRLRARR